jgi:hypothetical protein
VDPLEDAGEAEGIESGLFGHVADDHPPAIEQGGGVAHAAAERGVVGRLVAV